MIIGLTGGIASGKSTVSNLLRSYNIPVVDADLIARQVVEQGQSAYVKIVEHFGKEVLDEEENIDRKKLGGIIFTDARKRKALNGIVHPAVRLEMKKQAEHYLMEGFSHVVMDIPLLFESRLTHMVDRTLLIYVDEKTQFSRLVKRDNFTEEEAWSRIASQMPLKDKVELADAVITNNGSLEELKVKLDEQLREWKII
ncbi:dephospho-CoA kinase [Fictibacillus terranigra]|uniref:Dephospho-CoA kinase n=1 Tax=Fictibacillus terranigra TaxID=3058424 RepID=A0ABT8E3Z2_9BACL|nr:dephospho-CoA kinase [Fictibacillus sp. CENA-BCM004]MDN4072638.1 dephospho-CoA kinase [Fictibacillus sp. CENA-BCM004]